MIANLIYQNGTEFLINISKENTVAQLKEHLGNVYKCPSSCIFIIYKNKNVCPNQKISELTSLNNIDLNIIFQSRTFSFEKMDDQINIDVSEQFYILNKIREQKMKENFNYAFENHPEVFIRDPLRYVTIVVNGIKLEALVDSGATTSLISMSMVSKCGLEPFVDFDKTNQFISTTGIGETVGIIYYLEFYINDKIYFEQFNVVKEDDNCIIGFNWLKRNSAMVNFCSDEIILQSDKIKMHGSVD